MVKVLKAVAITEFTTTSDSARENCKPEAPKTVTLPIKPRSEACGRQKLLA